MGTRLIIGTTLLSAVVLVATSNTAASPSAAPPTPLTEAASKSKRGIVAVGGNIWENQGVSQPSINNPGLTSSLIVHQNSGIPRQNPSSSSGVGHNSAPSHKQFIPHTSQNYGSNPQVQKSGHSSQNFRSNPQVQNYGSAPHSQISGYNGFYSSPIQGTQQSQNPQSGQAQNSPISTPYFDTFVGSSSVLRVATEKQHPSAQTSNKYIGHKTAQAMYAPNHQNSFQEVPSTAFSRGNPIALAAQQPITFAQSPSYVSLNVPSFSEVSNAYQNQQVPIYATGSLPKNAAFKQVYAPQYQSAAHASPAVQTHGNILQTNLFKAPTVEFNGGNIPLETLQLQSAQDFPAFHKSIQSQPLIVDSGISSQGQQGLGILSLGNTPSPQSPLALYSAQENSHQPQVVPVESASSTPEFPKYKGARLERFPNYKLGGSPSSYQHLKSQPQLHFNKKSAQPAEPVQPATTHFATTHDKPFAEIRDDVEVIKKKKPPQRDSEEDDLDEGYKAIEREYGFLYDEGREEPQKSSKESDTESDYKPSKSSPFKYYDEKFKYSRPSSKDEAEEDDQSSKYHHYSSADDNSDEDSDGHSTRQYSDYELPRSIFDDGAEDDRKQKRKREDQADEGENEKAPKEYSNYGNDFEREFEDSYLRELPKNNYVHIKEVPEIDESSYKSQSSSGSSRHPSSDGSESRNNYRNSGEEEAEDSKGNGNEPYNYKTGSGSSYPRYSANKASRKAPKIVHEESFGYKKPHSESYSSLKKSPKDGSYEHASRSSYKTQSPENADKSAYEDGDSYSYSSGKSWQSNKKSPEASSSYGQASSVVQTVVKPDSTSSFRASALEESKLYSSDNMEIMRDLRGI